MIFLYIHNQINTIILIGLFELSYVNIKRFFILRVYPCIETEIMFFFRFCTFVYCFQLESWNADSDNLLYISKIFTLYKAKDIPKSTLNASSNRTSPTRTFHLLNHNSQWSIWERHDEDSLFANEDEDDNHLLLLLPLVSIYRQYIIWCGGGNRQCDKNRRAFSKTHSMATQLCNFFLKRSTERRSL